MNEQERQVIDDIFKRLEQVAQQSRDPEAERLISDKIRQQPYAPYAMAQAIFVQEQALTNLNTEVERLRAEVERARSQGGSFLSGLFGGGARPPEPRRPMSPGGSPWGGPPGGYPMQPGAPMGSPGPWGGAQRGGGFLQTAMATAAGVAGGMMLANALSNAFEGTDAAKGLASLTGADEAGGGEGLESITDAFYPDAGDQGGLEGDFGGDGGDGGDWT
jgi:hypothetical protein